MGKGILLMMVLFLEGCSSWHLGVDRSGSIGIGDDVILSYDEVDWSQTKKIEWNLDDFNKKDLDLILTNNRPYSLSINNESSLAYIIDLGSFLENAFLYSLETVDGDFLEPGFTSLKIYPASRMDLFFMPFKEGSYNLVAFDNTNKIEYVTNVRVSAG